jgi:hypothetical protein
MSVGRCTKFGLVRITVYCTLRLVSFSGHVVAIDVVNAVKVHVPGFLRCCRVNGDHFKVRKILSLNW